MIVNYRILFLVNNQGTLHMDVTRIAQLAIHQGGDEIAVLLQPELIFNTTNGFLDGNYVFADSENEILLLDQD